MRQLRHLFVPILSQYPVVHVYRGLFYVEWFGVRGGCSFCWYI